MGQYAVRCGQLKYRAPLLGYVEGRIDREIPVRPFIIQVVYGLVADARNGL